VNIAVFGGTGVTGQLVIERALAEGHSVVALTRDVSRIIRSSDRVRVAGGSGPWLYRRIVLPIFLSWLRPIIADKDRMEELLRSSGLEWVSVRLPNIVDGPGRPIRASASGAGLGLSITAASVAEFLVGQVSSSEWVGQTPSISN